MLRPTCRIIFSCSDFDALENARFREKSSHKSGACAGMPFLAGEQLISSLIVFTMALNTICAGITINGASFGILLIPSLHRPSTLRSPAPHRVNDQHWHPHDFS